MRVQSSSLKGVGPETVFVSFHRGGGGGWGTVNVTAVAAGVWREVVLVLGTF